MEGLERKTIDTTIKDIRNLFRLEKDYKTVKERILGDIRNVFRLKKENKAIKDTILRDIRNIFDNEEEENYFWSNSYIEYENNNYRNKTLSVESDTWKIQLTIAITFISSISNDEEHVMHSKSDNIEI